MNYPSYDEHGDPIFKTGDRIRVKQPRAGMPWHTYLGDIYKHECKPGSIGVVTRVRTSQGYVGVKWETPGGTATSQIDFDCIELVGNDNTIDQEIADLFGINPPKHCKTCRCSPVERARS